MGDSEENRNRVLWWMEMSGLADHLTDIAVTKPYKDAGDVGGLSPAQRWFKDEIEVRCLLGGTIPDEVFHIIKDTTNAKEIWDKLKAKFEGKAKGMLVELSVRRKFQRTRCGEQDDVRSHFSKLDHIREQLLALGREVSDDEYVVVLIGSLPLSYDGPMDSLTLSCDINEVDITPDAVTSAAIREYEKRSLRKEFKSGP